MKNKNKTNFYLKHNITEIYIYLDAVNVSKANQFFVICWKF